MSPSPASEVVDKVNLLLSELPKDDLRVTVDEAYTAFNGTGPALSQLIDSSRQFIALAQATIGPTRTLLDDAEPVLDAVVDSRADIAGFTRDLASFSEQLVMSDARSAESSTTALGSSTRPAPHSTTSGRPCRSCSPTCKPWERSSA